VRSGRASEPPPLSGAGAPQPADPLIGQVLVGRYLIQRKLGEGGMGAVYVALHTLLEKQVALKILHGEFARKPDLVERFMQEAKAASRIRHENVIDISDFGATPEGLVFFAMELLHGHDLHEEITRYRLSEVPMPWQRSRPIFLQICSALAAAHAQGIVHRDLKPENIYLVEWLGHKDFVKLLDFGIAKLTEVSEGDRKLTRTGMLFGTPEYMSPEQARGEPVDHRVDVYAMGCILYQLVTGHVPFEADNFMGVLSLHLTEEPATIVPAVFQAIGAPPELSQIVMTALAKDRHRRFSTVDDLANAIRALHGEPAQPVRTPTVVAMLPSGGGPGSSPPMAIAPLRPRSQWGTGANPSIADEPLPPPPRSVAPWVVGAVVAAAATGIAVFLAVRPSPPPAPAPQVVAPPVQPPAPPPPQLPAVPARVRVSIESVPPGASVFDIAAGAVVGTAPLDFSLPGGRDARRYTLRLAGYTDALIEIVPNEDATYTVPLKKRGRGAGATAAVTIVPAKSPLRESAAAAAAAHPPAAPARPTEARPAARPAAETPVVKPPPDEPVVKPPPETPPAQPTPPAGEDDEPTLKSFPGGAPKP